MQYLRVELPTSPHVFSGRQLRPTLLSPSVLVARLISSSAARAAWNARNRKAFWFRRFACETLVFVPSLLLTICASFLFVALNPVSARSATPAYLTQWRGGNGAWTDTAKWTAGIPLHRARSRYRRRERSHDPAGQFPGSHAAGGDRGWRPHALTAGEGLGSDSTVEVDGSRATAIVALEFVELLAHADPSGKAATTTLAFARMLMA